MSVQIATPDVEARLALFKAAVLAACAEHGFTLHPDWHSIDVIDRLDSRPPQLQEDYNAVAYFAALDANGFKDFELTSYCDDDEKTHSLLATLGQPFIDTDVKP